MNSNNTQLYGLTTDNTNFCMWMTEWKASPISPPTHDVMHQNQNIYNTKVTQVKKMVKNSVNPSCFNQVEDDLRASRQPGRAADLSLASVKKIRKEHRKFFDLMQDKQNYLKPIIYWLNSGKIAAAVNAIQK
jgi:hypothetical protein